MNTSITRIVLLCLFFLPISTYAKEDIIFSELDYIKKTHPIYKAISGVVRLMAIKEINRKNSGEENIGAGIVINENGFIVTSAHILYGSSIVYIRTPLDGKLHAVDIIEIKPDKDIAVLLIKKSLKDIGVSPLRIGNVQTTSAEDVIYGICGYKRSVSFIHGTVIRTGVDITAIINGTRDINFVNTIEFRSGREPSGCSGGPLINTDGEAIGLIVAGFENTGVTYALPINYVLEIARQIIAKYFIKNQSIGPTL